MSHGHATSQRGGLAAPPAFGPSLNLIFNFGASLCEPAVGLGGRLSTAAGVEGPLGIEGFLGTPILIFKGAWACGGAMAVFGLLFSRLMFGDGLRIMGFCGRCSGIRVVRTREERENWSLPLPSFEQFQ